MSDMFTHRIEIYTSGLVVTGSYDLTIYRRVSDAINGEPRRYLPLRDATVAPLTWSGTPQQIPNLMIDRSDSLLVATINEAAPPANYARKEQVRGVEPVIVMFFTDVFVVRGTFHIRPNQSFIEALERFSDPFLPLKNVQLFPLTGTFPPISRDFAILARERIVALYQVLDPSSEPSKPPAGTRPRILDVPVRDPAPGRKK